jgi:hypothetical protein
VCCYCSILLLCLLLFLFFFLVFKDTHWHEAGDTWLNPTPDFFQFWNQCGFIWHNLCIFKLQWRLLV